MSSSKVVVFVSLGLQEVPDLFHDEQQQQQQQQQQHQSQQHEYFMWLQQQQQRTDGAKFMNHGNSFQKGIIYIFFVCKFEIYFQIVVNCKVHRHVFTVKT